MHWASRSFQHQRNTWDVPLICLGKLPVAQAAGGNEESELGPPFACLLAHVVCLPSSISSNRHHHLRHIQPHQQLSIERGRAGGGLLVSTRLCLGRGRRPRPCLPCLFSSKMGCAWVQGGAEPVPQSRKRKKDTFVSISPLLFGNPAQQ